MHQSINQSIKKPEHDIYTTVCTIGYVCVIKICIFFLFIAQNLKSQFQRSPNKRCFNYIVPAFARYMLIYFKTWIIYSIASLSVYCTSYIALQIQIGCLPVISTVRK